MNDPNKLKIYRKRFGELSWFMSRLNEPLAKNSNFEDCVKGRFWESRYTSIALLDESAVLSCMAYVDLNPIRAGMVEELQYSLYTSINKRIDNLKTISTTTLNQSIEPMASGVNGRVLNIKLTDYIELVEWTGKSIIHPNKASMPAHITSIINQLNLQPDNWLSQVTQLGQNNSMAIGSVAKLKEKAEALKRSWIKGMASAKLLYAS